MAEHPDRPVRLRGLHDPEDRSEVQAMTPAERMSLVWQMTLQAWAFKEGLLDEPRLRRDVVRIVRRAG